MARNLWCARSCTTERQRTPSVHCVRVSPLPSTSMQCARSNLALDLVETIRPTIEAWLLNWILSEPLRRVDFVESSDGNCRITSALCSRLSETAATWGKLVAPWAEYVAHSLYAGRSAYSGAVR